MLNIVLYSRELSCNIFGASCNFWKKERGELLFFSDEAVVALSVEEFLINQIHSLFYFVRALVLGMLSLP